MFDKKEATWKRDLASTWLKFLSYKSSEINFSVSDQDKQCKDYDSQLLSTSRFTD